MFYAGLYIAGSNHTASVVVIEKVLKRVKKEYFIRKIYNMEQGGVGNLTDTLNEIITCGKYDKKKRVFSQSGRPAKNIVEPPALIAGTAFENIDLIRAIRKQKFKLDALFTEVPENTVLKDDSTSLRYGRNIGVNADDIKQTLKKAYSKGKITNIESYPELASDCSGEIFGYNCLALALGVYVCEKMRVIKRY